MLFSRLFIYCETMSAGDYISLKKSKMLKNYAPILSTGNKAIANYEHLVRKIALQTVIDSCSKDIYGVLEPAKLNDVPLNSCNYPANSFDGVLNVVLFNPEEQTIPLESTPSVPAKLQQPCYKGEQPCTLFFQAKRAPTTTHRRQWNLKKPSILSIYDSTTFRM
jgi:hypothetical protein